MFNKTILLWIKKLIQRLVNRFNYKIVWIHEKNNFPQDMDKEFLEIYKKCEPYTITSVERMYALYLATKYVVECKIPGDFVECGVWRGGSAMLMALTILQCKDLDRKIFLYDTFEGMPKPTERDRQIEDGKPAFVTLLGERSLCCPLDDTKTNILSTGYPENNIILVRGKVEDTIPSAVPSQISLLRLDTDWYESTYHELRHLFPLLSSKGAVIIDDYGHWAGAKEAADKYFSENKIPIFLNRIDYAGRLGIKI